MEAGSGGDNTQQPAAAGDSQDETLREQYGSAAEPSAAAASQLPSGAALQDVKSPEDAIAALDRLLAGHGVPAMQLQPPPGLIGAAA